MTIVLIKYIVRHYDCLHLEVVWMESLNLFHGCSAVLVEAMNVAHAEYTINLDN